MKEVNVFCPVCHHEQSFEVQSLLVNQSDNVVLDQLMQGDYFRFECKNCGYKHSIIYSMLYLDRELDVLIYLEPGDEDSYELLKIAQVLLQKDNTLLTRKVKTDNELFEKLLIFQSELDDRLVEMVKIESNHFITQQDPNLLIEKMFLNRDKQGYHVVCFLENNRRITLEVDPEVFSLAFQKYQPLLKRQNETLFMEINHKWAKQFFKSYMQTVGN